MMRIRPAGLSDLDATCSVLEAAFCRPDEARLVRELWSSDDLAVALVAAGRAAERANGAGDENGGGAVTGVAVLSHLAAPADCLALGPLAVRRDLRDRGIGKELIRASIAWAGRAGHAAIFVLGQPPYYERFGFSVDAAAPFASPYPSEFMLALELRPGALAGGGELRYPPAFAALG
jgi:putative acetyltransferase